MTNSLAQAAGSAAAYSYFDLGLSSAEQAVFAGLQVSATSTYMNFGVQDAVEDDAARFFQALRNPAAQAAIAGSAVDRIARNVVDAFAAESAWLMMRSTLPTDAHDVPRWHQDGFFFENLVICKTAFALKGPGTLLAPLAAPDVLGFDTLYRAYSDDEDDRRRLALADFMVNRPTEQVAAGAGVVFRVGGPDAAVHSEPPMPVARLFVSLVTGSKDQIEQIRLRNGFARPAFFTPDLK